MNAMILAAVDDLLFRSKIHAAAKQRGVLVVFARSPEDVLEQARALRPALAIFDLNSQRLQPLSTLAWLKADASLAGIRTVGFVSHVHVALIEAARSAGMDEVMPRSAFVAKLGDIVSHTKMTEGEKTKVSAGEGHAIMGPNGSRKEGA